MKKIGYLLFCIVVSFGSVKAQSASFASKIKPDYLTTQYAGSIGMLSAGVGFAFAKHHLHTSIHYGYVPKVVGGRLDIATLKLTYVPWAISSRKHGLHFLPFNPVVFGSYTFNRDFKVFWPQDQYVKGYYWWSPAMRWHIGFMSEIFVKQPNSTVIDGVSFYVEASTNNLYLESRRTNPESISLWDISTFGLGIKWKFK